MIKAASALVAFAFVIVAMPAQADPVTLRCTIDHYLDDLVLLLRVDDPRFPLFDKTPGVRILLDGDHWMKVTKANLERITATIDERLPGWPTDATRAEIDLDRISGELKIRYFGPEKFSLPDRKGVPPYSVALIAGESSGRCLRVQPLL